MITVLDTETTGLTPTDQVVELAAIFLDPEPPHDLVSSSHKRWKPTVPISHEARAVHHLTDAELARQPHPHEERPFPLPEPIFAHNAAFDRRMLTQTWPDIQWPTFACTWRLAQVIFPNAPRFSNQVMRYYLDLAPPAGLQAWWDCPPHDARHDAAVTTTILLKMLLLHPLVELLDLASHPLLLEGPVRFGKHKGTHWGSLPSDYLRWVLTADFDADIHHTARTILAQR